MAKRRKQKPARKKNNKRRIRKAPPARTFYRRGAGDKEEEFDDIPFLTAHTSLDQIRDEKSDAYHLQAGDDLQPAVKGTIGGALERFKRARVKLDRKTGYLYARKEQLKAPNKRATLWGLFVSDEDTFIIRPHVFSSKEAMTPREWREWLGDNYGGILPVILSGMSIRTDNKFWRLSHFIGINAGAPIRSQNSAPRKRRNKTKSQRRKSGHNRIRR